jgi:hypothetical protein
VPSIDAVEWIGASRHETRCHVQAQASNVSVAAGLFAPAAYR